MKKNLFIITAVVIGIIAAWLVLFPGKKPWSILSKKQIIPSPDVSTATVVTSADTGNVMNPVTTTTVRDANGFPVMYGDRGNLVAAIQEGLNLKFGSSLIVDGIFGRKTLKALSVHGYNDAVSNAQYLEIVL